ncbi:MAG TPA: DUF4157 domain-containing protein [Thermomicrobiaceae bacterium]|nr:DUF4157 domain-containing protein [Thermomicrobiaceae bacterium]
MGTSGQRTGIASGRGAGLRQAVRDLAGGGRRLDPGLRRTLEHSLATDLSGVRVHVGAAADALARAFHADAFTCGSDVYFRDGIFRPGTAHGLFLLAHEAAHVAQQARGAVGWGQAPADGIALTPADGPGEREADRAAARVLAGEPAAYGNPTRVPVSPARRIAPLLIQRHGSFEHRLLGDGPTSELVAISANASDRAAVLQRQINLLWQWHQHPDSVSAQDVTRLCPWIRTLQLGPDGVLLTYGELNALPDYLANPMTLETIPRSILLPILQVIRQEGYNQLTKLLTGSDPNVTFAQAAAAPWRLSLVNNIVETGALDTLTLRLGINGSDHYQGLLARNACHFAPYSWYRWQASHLIARDLAQRAHAATDPTQRAQLTHQAWTYHGYADHFLQDSFAAGHLVNKTLIMQWFIEWAQAQTALPFPDWERVKRMVVANQPALSGQPLYSPGYPGPSNDPQTVQEYATYAERLRASGVVADGGLDQAAVYQNYLIFLANAATQISSANVHDYFNDRSLWVSSAAQPTPYEVWGDYTLFSGANGAAGVQQTSDTAELSQHALLDLLSTGSTSTSVQQIRDRFPTQAGPDGAHQQDLQTWSNGLRSFCMNETFPGFLPVLKTLLTGIFSPRLGIVSQDQDFSNIWYASLPKAGYTGVASLAYGGRVFAGSNGYVYELDPTTGTVLHSLLVTGSIGVGDYDTRLATDGRTLFVGVHGYVYGVPLNSWQNPWNVGVGGTGAYEPVSVLARGGRLFAGSNGYVYELNPANGQIVHNLRLSSIFGVGNYDTRLASDGATLYVGMHGYVYGVSLGSWKSSWEVGVGGTGAYKPVEVLLQNGQLFAGSNGYVYQVNPGNGQLVHSLLVTSVVGVGDYTTRLATDGRNLYVGVHGYAYSVPLASWQSAWDVGLGGVGSFNPVSVLSQSGRCFAAADGYAYELNPANGQVLQKLLLASVFGIGNYDTSLTGDGANLYAGTHGYTYKIYVLPK